MATILTVDDETGIREFIADVLSDAGHEVLQADSPAEALERMADGPVQLAIVDFRMPGKIDGIELVRRIRAEWPETQVILLSAYGTVGMAVEAMRLGAFDFLEKPLESPEELRRLVTRALNWRGSRTGVLPEGERSATTDSGPAAAAKEGRGLAKLGREMKRRHVYNVAATYAAIGFILLQAAELVLPAFPMIPDWGYDVLVVVVLAGFPVAIALGWIFDIKVSRTERARILEENRS